MISITSFTYYQSKTPQKNVINDLRDNIHHHITWSVLCATNQLAILLNPPEIEITSKLSI